MHVATSDIRSREYRVPVAPSVELTGDLWRPPSPRGLVVFVHGSGSSWLGPRNEYVAEFLRSAGFATLLVDLLTNGEEHDPCSRFEIETRGDRVAAIIDRLVDDPEIREPIALFGASTGAAAAVTAAAMRPGAVVTIVSRGGRPDLAGADLGKVPTPMLLIVGGADERVLEINRSILPMLPAGSDLEVVPGATHLFDEPGAVHEVAGLTRDWLERQLERTHDR